MTPLLPLLIRNKDNILQIMEARNMIEVTTASLAAERAGEADIHRLAVYLRQMIDSGHMREEFATNDYLFHKQIAKSTGNRIILQMYQAIEDLLMGQHLRNIGLPRAIEHGIAEHQKIFAAIEGRDAKRAEAAIFIASDGP